MKDMLPQMFAQMTDMLVDNSRVMNSSSADLSKTSEMMEFMKTMSSDLKRDMKEGIESIGSTLNERLIELMSSVNMTVTNSLSRLNLEAFAEGVSVRVREWMSVQMESHGTTQESVASLIKQLTEKLRDDNMDARERHSRLLSLFDSLPFAVASHTLPSSVADTHRMLGEIKGALSESMTTREREQRLGDDVVRRLTQDITQMCSDAKMNGVSGKDAIDRQLALIPSLVKSTVSDAMADMKRDMGAVEMYAKTSSNATTEVALMRKATDDVLVKLDDMMRQTAVRLSSNKVKGIEGERTLYERLCGHLSSHNDGYKVIQTGTKAHSCDMNVTRLGFADVRIEVKAYLGTVQRAGSNVGGDEILKFHDDLSHLNAHGIMVSLHSGICGKGFVDFDQLPNGKIAVYLSNNEYDVVMVHHMIKLLYRMDEMLTSATGADANVFKISHDTMKRVQSHMKDFGRKVDRVKTSMKESLSVLNELTFDMVEQLMMSGSVVPVPVPVPAVPVVVAVAVTVPAAKKPTKAAIAAAAAKVKAKTVAAPAASASVAGNVITTF